ncbi:syntaxin-3-like [Mytilus californianus]|uniref:syntaxin-3-like n=1 Tax=Mytilus californianus TaxID=6549 RepID=UPI0022474FE9|nr:syntaxin-3-like [Mytilus californianus]
MVVKDRTLEMQKKREELGRNSKRFSFKKKNTPMDILMKKVKCIENDLIEIQSHVTEVTKLQNNLYCSPFVTQTELKNMEKLSDHILTKSVKIRKEIEALSNNNNEISEPDAYQKVCVNQIERLSHQLREIMNTFRSNQADYIDKTRTRFQRKVEIVSKEDNPDIDMNQVDFQTHSVFTDNIIIQMQTAKSDLQELEDREKELHQLENQIHEVNQLFKEMNVLVGEQGDMLNNIEKNVEDAVVHVTKTNKVLRQAKEYKSKARKKKFICAAILGAVIVITVVVLIIVFA